MEPQCAATSYQRRRRRRNSCHDLFISNSDLHLLPFAAKDIEDLAFVVRKRSDGGGFSKASQLRVRMAESFQIQANYRHHLAVILAEKANCEPGSSNISHSPLQSAHAVSPTWQCPAPLQMAARATPSYDRLRLRSAAPFAPAGA